MGKNRLTLEELVRRRKLRQRIRNGIGVTSDRAFTHVGKQPIEHRKTKQLPSGAIRSPLSSQVTTEDDIADLIREWRGGEE